MADPICIPPAQCCPNNQGGHAGCWDPTKCEACVNGAVIKNDAAKAKALACLDCDTNTTICSVTNPDCCFGKCFKLNKDCKTCDQNTKDVIGCPTGFLCCQNDTLDGIGCWDPNSSANKCKKCVNGQLVDNKCSDLPDTPYCCPDTGRCIDNNCYNCDGTPKCTGNTWCCNCPTKTCCNNCEDCSGTITLSHDDQQQCLKCENGQKVSKCLADQECCQGTCIAKDGCKWCSPNFGVTDECTGGKICCGKTCWDPDTNKCGKCENQVFTDNKCGPNFKCCSSDGKCIPSNDNCQDCFGRTAPDGQVCCTDPSDGSKSFVVVSNCCGGNKLKTVQSEACCNGTIYDSDEAICCGNQTYNQNIYGCCNGNRYLLDGTQKCCDGQVIDIDSRTDCCEYRDNNNAPVSIKYDKLCKVCTPTGPVDSYDSGCFDCSRYSGPIPKCKDSGPTFACCSIWQNPGDSQGQCYDTRKDCDTCDATTGNVTKKCTDPDLPDCCAGNCWNKTNDVFRCSVCVEEMGGLVPKCPTVAGVGQNSFGKKFLIRVKDGKNSCCADTGECYGPCDSCSSDPASPTANCQNNTNGDTACCNYSGGTCYNPECYYCDRPTPKLRSACKSCCGGQCCQSGVCCESLTTPATFTCCGNGEKCCLGQCVPNDYIECQSMCVAREGCCNGQLLSFGQSCCGGVPSNCQCCNNECLQPGEQCCTNSQGNEFKCSSSETCCGDFCCDQICCNNRDCCDVACCAGPHGGCYNSAACQKCDGGIVSSTKSADEECCGGVPYNPRECEKCVAGVKTPYTPSAANCYCYYSPSLLTGKEYCGCPLAGLRIQVDTANTFHCCDAATFKVKLVSSLTGASTIVGNVDLNNSSTCDVITRNVIVSNASARDLLNNLAGQNCCQFRIELVCDPSGFGSFQPFGPDQCHTSIANGSVFKKLSDGSEVRIWNGLLDNTGDFDICDETLLV